jgi:hypothetical protein
MQNEMKRPVAQDLVSWKLEKERGADLTERSSPGRRRNRPEQWPQKPINHTQQWPRWLAARLRPFRQLRIPRPVQEAPPLMVAGRKIIVAL